MKRILSLTLSFLLLSGLISYAQVNKAELNLPEVPATPYAGLENAYSFDTPALTPAPRGYEAVYVSHYSRHGSRYAYSGNFLNEPYEIFVRAEQEDNLTDEGREMLRRLRSVKEDCTLRLGELTDLGWLQQQRLGREMFSNFPTAFKGHPDVLACASGSIRSILSMSAFCLGLQQKDPKLYIREAQGSLYYGATSPNDRKNVNKTRRAAPPALPFQEDENASLDNFFGRNVDFMAVLERLFPDVDKACRGRSRRWIVWDIWMTGSNMVNHKGEDLLYIFTPEQLEGLWRVDNYHRFLTYYPYQSGVSQIVEDILADLSEAADSGKRGAKLRFGHDHCVMPMLMILDVEGYGRIPSSPEEVEEFFHTYDTPMASNFQFVLYQPKGGKKGEILVKIVYNGREVHLPVETDNFPYYPWSALKAHIQTRLDRLPVQCGPDGTPLQ